MDKKFWLVIFVLAMVALFFIACGDDDDDNTDNNTDPVTLTGAMQKGPLLKGSSLTVSMLEVDGVRPRATPMPLRPRMTSAHSM